MSHFSSLLSESYLCPFLSAGVSSNQVVVPEKVNAVLGKNITLGCRIEVGSNLSLTQSSWERRLPSGTITLAVFNPEYGTSYSPDYGKRISFVSPSRQDATITLEGVGFADIGSYTCKVATFPLGNTQASTFVNVLGKVELLRLLSFTELFVILSLNLTFQSRALFVVIKQSLSGH